MPRQESVVASLHELRAIEQQRIADELAARAAQDAAREAARRADEARLAAEARAVRDAVLAEAARREADAEAVRRAAEVAIACAEATARARAEAELHAERMAEEMRIRREQVARTRPIGLLAVITALVLAGAALGVVLVEQRADLDERTSAVRDVTARANRLHDDTTALERTARGLQDQVEQRQAALAAQQAEIAKLKAAAAAPGPTATFRPHAATPPPAATPVVHAPIVLDAVCTTTVLGCNVHK